MTHYESSPQLAGSTEHRLQDAEEPNSAPEGVSGAEQLIAIEGNLRTCTSFEQLWLHLANEPLTLLPAGQAVVLTVGSRWRLEAASGVSRVPRDAPLVLWYERLVDERWQASGGALEPLAFEASEASCDERSDGAAALRYFLWLPLADDQRSVAAGWLLAREIPWEPGHMVLAQRLAGAYAHTAVAINGRRRPFRPWRRRQWWLALGVGVTLAALLALVRVPLTTRAPVEVVPQAPFVVTAPLAGVVERIVVPPGAAVSPGDALVQFVDVALESDYDVAQRKVEVAEAKMFRVQQAAIRDPQAKRELALAESERQLAGTERDYARAMLDKTVIHAVRPGIALYSDPKDWVGRPVDVGEALMQVADPEHVEFRLQVPAEDAATLSPNALVDVFLDAAPLEPIQAHVARAAYKAEPDAAGIAVFGVTAVAESGSWTPRLGLRGTARLHGAKVSLFYYLFRRPLVALRQLTGL
ncbi:HlyD family efflux transporter periplasmic adaptor subunit [Halomonas sp. V046]|uniref:HlyD family efflux transporter periplasmic adaptor subunit n=1 Tax=Halomonas sp. V046 TaxID=3459611 RepID=UPI0040449738